MIQSDNREALRNVILTELEDKIGRDVSDVDPDLSLVDIGLSSLDLVEVILSIDEAMPSSIELYELAFEDFETINRILETFSGQS
ncbi:MAG: acyl carrier protein [Sulfitobacter sp.]